MENLRKMAYAHTQAASETATAFRSLLLLVLTAAMATVVENKWFTYERVPWLV